MKTETKHAFLRGMRDGFPIGLGYFAVAFSLGVIAGKAGLNAIQGFFTSLFVRASAGEYGGYTLISESATYFELILMCIVANARYLLMGAALTQKFREGESIIKRILVGTCITDEIFGISIAYPGDLRPAYPFGATVVAAPMWAIGTTLGIIAGQIMPLRAVSALSVALYGMFLAIIVPPAKKNGAVAICVGCGFLLSYLCSIIPVVQDLSSGLRTIILTIVIAAVAAIIRPVKDDEDQDKPGQDKSGQDKSGHDKSVQGKSDWNKTDQDFGKASNPVCENGGEA